MRCGCAGSARRLSCHALFPSGTNVELVEVETPERVRILIWERGVGPTAASGTGACAAAVAAASYGGARRDVEVVSPGGSQRVAWRDDGLYLTGWAEVSVGVGGSFRSARGPYTRRGDAFGNGRLPVIEQRSAVQKPADPSWFREIHQSRSGIYRLCLSLNVALRWTFSSLFAD